MKIFKKVIIPLLGVVSLSGCSTTPMNINDPDPAVMRLAQIAENIQRHDNDLVDIEMARYVKQFGAPPKTSNANKIPSLQKVESLGEKWHGPLDKLVIMISTMAGLNPPVFYGVKPSGDVFVNVNTDYRPLIDMLQDAGVQAGSRAKVVVKAKDKRIVTTYVPY
jgi:defect-in-organelle-trafficking protein DotD